MAIWGKVGTQILSVSNALYASSKSALIGDGSFEGFVDSVLSNVPSAASPSEPFVYGHLVYSQTISSVTRRVSDIMPGDVVVLEDCHFHGRKGLQTYNTRIGKNDQPACGIINEYEQKKHKLRVYQANQRVGNQTVELASYRLNDLKAGTVKVRFVVLSAD
ncbi:hypothetical protein SISNIDRAFT_415505 [Sistotremastrum niveocremeum HHB9708]|uniref:BBC1/AIM3 cysteine proteinase-fold domain-containing protein n=1 Tax=Sistotremastrum niveocremeum HHB9708 TaxID=1314777 RepID=A0A164RBF4_9AGAM|nr:hypothetical protein SISNIDRAFT_415505 [Sistotremastrum niveocremeum HHB9708]